MSNIEAFLAEIKNIIDMIIDWIVGIFNKANEDATTTSGK